MPVWLQCIASVDTGDSRGACFGAQQAGTTVHAWFYLPYKAISFYTRQFLALTPQFSHVDPIPSEIIYAVQPCALKDHESNLSPSLKSARKKVSTSRGTCSAQTSNVLFTCQHRSRLVFHGHSTIPAATIIGPSPRSQGEPTWTGAACAQHAKDTQRVQCGSTPMPRPALSHAHVTTKKMQTNPTSEGCITMTAQQLPALWCHRHTLRGRYTRAGSINSPSPAPIIQDTIAHMHVQARQISMGAVAARAHRRCVCAYRRQSNVGCGAAVRV